MAELLSEKDLESVTGGRGGERFRMELTGPYWDNSDGTGTENSLAVGWADLRIEYAAPGKPCPYRIYDKEGPIGWTCRSNFKNVSKE